MKAQQSKRKMPSAREMMRRADAQQHGYERRIANQVDTISRLLDDPDAGAEIARLHERIAELEAIQVRIVPVGGSPDLDRNAVSLAFP